MGATYRVNAAPGDWLQDFALDTDVKLNGRASLRVKSSTESGVSSSAYKMLAVPATAGVFWVRFYIRSEIDMGGEHNPWAEASGSDDPNDALILEFAEDVGIAFNHRDDVVRPDGYSRENPLVLPKDTWYCIEIGFDSQTRRQQLFIDGTQRINAMNWPAQLTGTFRVFKFGFNQLHGPPRKTWFDDVAVAPQRIPCR
jgi:hypothetical protein